MTNTFANFVSNVKCVLANWKIMKTFFLIMIFTVMSAVKKLNQTTIVISAWKRNKEIVLWNGFYVGNLNAKNGCTKYVTLSILASWKLQQLQILIFVLFVETFKRGKSMQKLLIVFLSLMKHSFSHNLPIWIFPFIVLLYQNQCVFKSWKKNAYKGSMMLTLLKWLKVIFSSLLVMH